MPASLPSERAVRASFWGLLVLAVALRLAHLWWRFDLDWEPDAYEHALMAKSAWAHGWSGAWTVLNVWAKPLFTAPVAVLWGLLPKGWPLLPAEQVFNGACWLLTSVAVAQATARALDSRGAGLLTLALALFGFVPFRASISALTEPVGALVVGLSLWAWGRDRRILALGLAGLAALARLDAVVLAAVLWLWDLRGARRLARALGTAALMALPIISWDALGAWHGGRVLYLLDQYPLRSPYGHGDAFWYARELLRFDPLVALGLLAALARWKRLPELARIALVQSLAYVAVLSALWALGRFGLAGMLRYLVLAYPCFVVAAASGYWALPWPRSRWAMAGALAMGLAVQGAELSRLVRPPVLVDSQLTSLWDLGQGSAPYRELGRWRARLSDEPVYADRPEALYYLGLTHGMYEAPGPRDVADPELAGYFVFSGGWSEAQGARRAAFDGLHQIVHLFPDIDVYEKQFKRAAHP